MFNKINYHIKLTPDTLKFSKDYHEKFSLLPISFLVSITRFLLAVFGLLTLFVLFCWRILLKSDSFNLSDESSNGLFW